ncbi:hypothetical protein SAMN06298226_1043 [Nitrosovibrio sp. Nv4]|nr:hypothetical protein SAMN06298226_1043 [Nitrosovibrio sp. Nv4]
MKFIPATLCFTDRGFGRFIKTFPASRNYLLRSPFFRLIFLVPGAQLVAPLLATIYQISSTKPYIPRCALPSPARVIYLEKRELPRRL